MKRKDMRLHKRPLDLGKLCADALNRGVAIHQRDAAEKLSRALKPSALEKPVSEREDSLEKTLFQRLISRISRRTP